METKMRNYPSLLISLMLGALLLAGFSFVQKLIIGVNPFVLKGYIIPVIFGGTTGVIIGYYIQRIRLLNKQMSTHINKLESVMPICAYCKKIRKPESDSDDKDSWVQIERYISERTSSEFSHGFCPECLEERYGEKAMSKKQSKGS
jgi:hypothetical protein